MAARGRGGAGPPEPVDGGGDADRELFAVAALVAALPDAVLAVDGDDRILAFNEAASGLFPVLRAGGPLASYVRSPDVLGAVANARDAKTAARASWLERAPVERTFEVGAAPVLGLPCGALVLLHIREVSEARRFERMRVEFVANASHELRTPLASLIGFIDTLRGPARNDERARERFLAIMRDQAQRMARLVDDLLSLSRVEQHAHLRPRDRVEVVALLHHLVDTLRPLADESGATLVVVADAPVDVAGDRDELMRAAENLIENAIKYGASEAADRRVLVEAGRSATEAMIGIRDFGRGIAPEHLPRLTERFYRVDAGQSRLKGGTGLGLALVKHVVARHRGRLTVASQPGAGSDFRIYLPLHKG